MKLKKRLILLTVVIGVFTTNVPGLVLNAEGNISANNETVEGATPIEANEVVEDIISIEKTEDTAGYAAPIDKSEVQMSIADIQREKNQISIGKENNTVGQEITIENTEVPLDSATLTNLGDITWSLSYLYRGNTMTINAKLPNNTEEAILTLYFAPLKRHYSLYMNYNPYSGYYVASFTVNENMYSGEYSIADIFFYDGENGDIYYYENANFTISGGKAIPADRVEPAYYNLYLNSKYFNANDIIKIGVDAYDKSGLALEAPADPFNNWRNYSSITIGKVMSNGAIEFYAMYEFDTVSGDRLSKNIDVTSELGTGKYVLIEAEIYDIYGNYTFADFVNRNENASNLTPENSPYVFAVNNEVKDKKIRDFVTRLYQHVLNRKPDTSGLNYHTNMLIGLETTGTEVAKGFVFSPEFKSRNLSNSQYIEVLYKSFMDRKPDTGGMKYWKNMLDNGVSKEYVFKGFAVSPEFDNICLSYDIYSGDIHLTEPRDQNADLTMFVSRCYQKALGRTAEVGGLNYYTQEILLKRVTPVQAAQNFIFSPEFKNKNLSNTEYVKVLYRTFMGREFDQSGLNYHLNRMKTGVNREEILLGFAYSPEFTAIMKGFGL